MTSLVLSLSCLCGVTLSKTAQLSSTAFPLNKSCCTILIVDVAYLRYKVLSRLIISIPSSARLWRSCRWVQACSVPVYKLYRYFYLMVTVFSIILAAFLVCYTTSTWPFHLPWVHNQPQRLQQLTFLTEVVPVPCLLQAAQDHYCDPSPPPTSRCHLSAELKPFDTIILLTTPKHSLKTCLLSLKTAGCKSRFFLQASYSLFPLLSSWFKTDKLFHLLSRLMCFWSISRSL